MALGYKQLLEVEDAFRTIKQVLELRPAYHRLSERIKSHVLLGWLALLLIRIAENWTGETRRNLRKILDRMHVGEFVGPDGKVLKRTETTAQQKQVFKTLGVPEPPTFFTVVPAKRESP